MHLLIFSFLPSLRPDGHSQAPQRAAETRFGRRHDILLVASNAWDRGRAHARGLAKAVCGTSRHQFSER